ncbi:MAG: glycosyltransferase family 2 protein [Ignavibacteriaceae bacterium]|nr:glycosyltransferase family 2 protein [Ignavibacteriaceae bacterium]
MISEQTMSTVKYVLITAAKNEESFIEKTIQSVINQLHKPAEWIIVSDGSTDNTESIVCKYASENSFIKLLINNRKEARDFASKVYAINIGLKNIQTSDYDYIGILDADVSFEKDYYSSLIEEFEKNPKLGIVGGNYFDIINGRKVPVRPSPYSVRGATQFYRKECFDKIDGIKPIKYGGEDALACYAARLYGWEIKNINSIIVLHHRPTGITGSNLFRTRLRDGSVEYNLCYHPLFQFVKCIKRIPEKPFLIGSILRFFGFWLSYIKREKRDISNELFDFIREDQIRRLIKMES